MNRPSKNEYYLQIASAVSARSTCLRRQYGCVIVKNNEIIATGYNGNPRGDINCCDVFKECPRKDKPHNSGDYSDCYSVHAEQNAMLSAARKDMIGATLYLAGFETINNSLHGEGATRPIIPCEPCPICERMIRNAGITRIVTLDGVKDYI